MHEIHLDHDWKLSPLIKHLHRIDDEFLWGDGIRPLGLLQKYWMFLVELDISSTAHHIDFANIAITFSVSQMCNMTLVERTLQSTHERDESTIERATNGVRVLK